LCTLYETTASNHLVVRASRFIAVLDTNVRKSIHRLRRCNRVKVKHPTSRYGPNTRRATVQAPLDLIDGIYGTALDAKRWPRILSDIGRFVGGQQMILFSVGVDPGDGDFFWASNSIPLESQVDYVRHYWQHDPWNAAILADPITFCSGSVQIDQDIIEQRTFDRSVFRNEFLRTVDVYRACGSVINSGTITDLPRMYLSTFRNERTDPYVDEEAARLAALVPHLQRSLRLGYRLARERAPIGSVGILFEEACDAVLLVADGGRVVHPNAKARSILARNDGLHLDRHGVLSARRQVDDARLGKLLHATAETTRGIGTSPGGTVAVGRTEGRESYLVSVSPLPRSHPFLLGSMSATALVTIDDPDMSSHAFDRALRDAFGLTEAECRVANGIFGGESAREMADRFGTSVHTVQSQIKSVYSKTGTRRQGELIRLIFTLPR
jgi:DNA-binding CsgD family transcriptional regulator